MVLSFKVVMDLQRAGLPEVCLILNDLLAIPLHQDFVRYTCVSF